MVRRARRLYGRNFLVVCGVLAGALATSPVAAQAPVAGPNVNMVGGPAVLRLSPFEVLGDVILKAQNEPSCATSSRNPLHILCAANDYRMVDVPGVSQTQVIRDAWQGLFQSVDGGGTWQSTLHPGFFLDPAPHLLKTLGLRAAADAVVRAGPAGGAWHSFIAFSGPEKDVGGVFVSTFIDLNNDESDRMPFKYVRTIQVDKGTAGRFIDKPWMFVDGPNGRTCTLDVTLPDGQAVTQTIPASTIHLAYSVFVGVEKNVRTRLMYTRSFDCGRTFEAPKMVSEGFAINQGAAITKPLVTSSNRIYLAWRLFNAIDDVGADDNHPDAILAAVSNDNCRSFSKAAIATTICPFDQGTTSTSFRTTAFPAITADATGRVCLVWADRGRDATGACRAGPSAAARIMMASSTDGVTWTTPVVAVPSSGLEHQIQPSLIFAGGLLHLAWLDFFDDASEIFDEHVNEAKVFELAIRCQTDPTLANCPAKRHTGDVRAALARPGGAPVFSATTVSRYIEGIYRKDGEVIPLQLQWNAVNRRWARRAPRKVPSRRSHTSCVSSFRRVGGTYYHRFPHPHTPPT